MICLVFQNVCLCRWIRGVCMLVSVWQPQRMDRLPKHELVIWNSDLSTQRVWDWVTGRPVFPGSHNSLSMIGGIALIEVLSLAYAQLLQFSYSARSVLTAQIHTQQSTCLSCRVSHVNTVGYVLSERKQLGENWMCQYYMHTFRLKETVFLIICTINVNQQKMLN